MKNDRKTVAPRIVATVLLTRHKQIVRVHGEKEAGRRSQEMRALVEHFSSIVVYLLF